MRNGRGVDLGWSRLSHFQCRVVFRNPVFDFAVKPFCLDEDFLRFRLRRNVGEGVVDRISLSPTCLKIVGIIVHRFVQHKFRTF
jgi:hypothetical protein